VAKGLLLSVAGFAIILMDLEVTKMRNIGNELIEIWQELSLKERKDFYWGLAAVILAMINLPLIWLGTPIIKSVITILLGISMYIFGKRIESKLQIWSAYLSLALGVFGVIIYILTIALGIEF